MSSASTEEENLGFIHCLSAPRCISAYPVCDFATKQHMKLKTDQNLLVFAALLDGIMIFH